VPTRITALVTVRGTVGEALNIVSSMADCMLQDSLVPCSLLSIIISEFETLIHLSTPIKLIPP
jgi:hypothetical protein